MAMLTAQNIAEYFLSLCSEECGDTVSNLKLQKLVYYAQGFHLAIYDTPLYTEQIKAWKHGPVIPSLYHEYNRYKDGSIPKPAPINYKIYNPEVRKLLDEIWKVYGQFSAWKLRNMTHEEAPYKNTPLNGIVTRSSMRVFFKQLVKK